MKALYTLLFILIGSSLSGYGQTYEVIKIQIKCESKDITGDINSPANDFAPYVYDNKIYFSSDRDPDQLLGGENNWSNFTSINLYQADLRGLISADTKIKNLRLVSERLYTGDHTGPASFSVTGDTLFLSKVKAEKNGGTLHPQLYYVVRLKNRFSKPTALPFNDPEYSFGHPFYDSQKSRLYFASNISGGKGGKDLYYSDLTDTGWTKPEPLKDVNTAGDEIYPFVVDNILFYATNPNGKNGGYDIFWKLLGSPSQSQPLEGVNGEKDDFGIFVFPGMTMGYYSSDRGGNDDLRFFDMERIVTIRNEMAGEFAYKKLEGIPSGITVQILYENDFVLHETKTDENGNFVFREIDYDEPYSIHALSDEELELTLKNPDGDKAAQFLADEENVFVYRKIGPDNSGTLSLIPDDMIDFNLNEGHLSGQLIYEDEPGEHPANMKVSLIDEKGEEALYTLTDDMGNFDFKKLSMSKNYILKVPESDDDMTLLIYDLKGNVVAQLKANDKGAFTYRKINPDYSNQLELVEENEETFSLNEQTIWGYFEYENDKKLNRKDLIVTAYNENGELIAKRQTDEDGVFRFRSLPTEKSLLFKLEENDNNFVPDDFTLYIFDRNGQKIAGLKKGEDGFFKYRPLGYDLDSELSQIEADNIDFILGAQKSRDRILVYFDSNQSQVKSSDMKIVKNLYQVMKNNPDAKVEINAYADARSSDEYNLILSKKRGDWIVKYLTDKGISDSRCIVNAYGESRLIDENNDALNRRAEIHLY